MIKFNYSKKKIQDLKVGDYVKSFNLESMSEEPRRILEVFNPKVPPKNQRKITFSDGGFIVNSTKHPLLVDRLGFKYVETKDLFIGDKCLRDDGKKITISSIEKCDFSQDDFYDIHVDYNNNFFAGNSTSICNHNSAVLTSAFYHYEIELFSQLSDSKGTVETRARHTDQSIILNKWFLKKALNREDIYLFHMNEVPLLYDALGFEEKFNEIYEKYAKSVPSKHKKKVNAWELLNLFLYERSITGRLYFVFADNFCKSSYKENLYAANLCMEISQIMGSLDGFNKRTLKFDGTPEIGVCILSNINLGYIKNDEIPRAANFLVRFLDTMIDEGDYGIDEIEYAAKKRRALGIGISNLFGYLAKNKLFYNTEEAREKIHEIMELFSYSLHKTSIELAKENTEFGFDGEITKSGRCELFEDTIYSESKFPFERFENNKFTKFNLKCDWESLRKELMRWGIRNSSLSAIPPAGNSAEISNSTNGIEPPREIVTIKTDKTTTYKKLVPFYKTSKNYYTTAWSEEFNNKDYFKLVSVIQKFVDQAISLNQYTDVTKTGKVKIQDILEEIITCFNLGIKTLYYENFRSRDDIDGLQENVGCESGGCTV